MTCVFRYWDVAESNTGRPPNLGKSSTARVMQAILVTGAKLCAYHVDGGQYTMDAHCPVVYRVAVPIGKEEQFESISGYRLDPVEEVRGSLSQESK